MKLKHLILLSLSGTIIALDQLTKHLITANFRLYETVPVFKSFFSITYVRNPGAAFGLLADADPTWRVPFFVIVPIIALGIIGYVFRNIEDKDFKLAAALSLVIGGAVGNLIDRAAYNYVIDFFLFYWGQGGPQFPAFNVADAAICVGIGLLILDMIQKEKLQRQESNNAASAS